MSQLVFSIQGDPKEVGFNASEGMDFPESERKWAKAKASFFHAIYIGFLQVWPRLEVGLSPSKDLDLKQFFPLQII